MTGGAQTAMTRRCPIENSSDITGVATVVGAVVAAGLLLLVRRQLPRIRTSCTER